VHKKPVYDQMISWFYSQTVGGPRFECALIHSDHNDADTRATRTVGAWKRRSSLRPITGTSHTRRQLAESPHWMSTTSEARKSRPDLLAKEFFRLLLLDRQTSRALVTSHAFSKPFKPGACWRRLFVEYTSAPIDCQLGLVQELQSVLQAVDPTLCHG